MRRNASRCFCHATGHSTGLYNVQNAIRNGLIPGLSGNSSAQHLGERRTGRIAFVMARPNFEKERVLNEDELAQLTSKLAHLSESGVKARVPGLRDHRRAFSNGDLDPTIQQLVTA